MPALRPAFLAIIVSFCSMLLLSGCSSQDETAGHLQELYQKASKLSRQGEYERAIALYDKALAADTLGGLSERPVLEMNRKRHLEGLVGDYSAALHTAGFLEKHAGELLPDSLRGGMLAEKAMWLSELGDFRGAVAALAAISAPSEDQHFELAALELRIGEVLKAETIYSRYAGQERDPVSRMRGVAGLLQCRMRDADADLKAADDLAMNIAAISGDVLALEGDLKRRIRALRESSRSLQLLSKHQRNASYLLFRALILAEETRNPFLIEQLRYESNAVIVRKPAPYRETGDFFGMQDMQFAEAAAQLRLATGNGELTPPEQIDALRRGLLLYQNYLPRYPGAEMLRLADAAERRLSGLLVRETRIFELFDALQQFEMLALQRTLQNSSGYFRLGKEHAALEGQVNFLRRDISGLLQRKADIFLKARGYEMNRAAETALQSKRGRMIELLEEVRKIDPAAASVLQMKPVTLQTLQRSLKKGQLVVQPVLADSFYAVMTISNREFGIAGTPVPLDSLYDPASGLRRLVRDFAVHGAYEAGTFRSRPDSQWFIRAAAEPLKAMSAGYDHILVAADPALPLQMLGIGDKRISMTASFREIVHASLHSGGKTGAGPIRFYPAERIEMAQLRKLFHPRERVFLLWKPFGKESESLMQAAIEAETGLNGTPSEALYRFSGSSGSAETGKWIFVSAYGSR